MAFLFNRNPKNDYRGYYYMDSYELLRTLKKLNPKWLTNINERSKVEHPEQSTIDELKKELLLVELQLESMSNIGNEIFVDGPLTGTREEQIKKLELQKTKLRLKKLIKKYYQENPNLEIQSIDELTELESLIQELLVVEIRLESMSNVGNEIFVEAPLTGTREEQEKKWKLQRRRSDLLESIVESFKKNTDMSTISLEQKRFLYSKEEFKSIKRNR
ncbi:MAG: hypothetical protein IJE89_00495 [Bacilli bacterium]|nr:hypothetical protein [Bacilli bacterium]